jgi:hypothetical protein
MPTIVKTIECINTSEHEGLLEGDKFAKDKIIVNPIVNNSRLQLNWQSTIGSEAINDPTHFVGTSYTVRA